MISLLVIFCFVSLGNPDIVTFHLNLKYHPDVNKEPGATEKFKEISAAYEVCTKCLGQ